MIITPGMSSEEIFRMAKEQRAKSKYDFSKLCGTVVRSEDPLTLQRKLRNEWW